jgi:hypothetical protein
MTAATLSPAIVAAIDNLRSASAAVEAFNRDDVLPAKLLDAENCAVEALALAPCATVDDLLAKLRELLAFERGYAIGGEFEMSGDGSLPIALDAFFKQEPRS